MALGLGAQGRGAGLGLAAELVRAVGVEAAELLVVGEEVVVDGKVVVGGAGGGGLGRGGGLFGEQLLRVFFCFFVCVFGVGREEKEMGVRGRR